MASDSRTELRAAAHKLDAALDAVEAALEKLGPEPRPDDLVSALKAPVSAFGAAAKEAHT